jgi:hypothetical protein
MVGNQTGTKKAEEYEQTEWEKSHDKVARGELKKNILGFFDEMEDSTFHRFYNDLWCWSATNLCYKISKSSEARQAREIADLKEEISRLKKNQKEE